MRIDADGLHLRIENAFTETNTGPIADGDLASLGGAKVCLHPDGVGEQDRRDGLIRLDCLTVLCSQRPNEAAAWCLEGFGIGVGDLLGDERPQGRVADGARDSPGWGEPDCRLRRSLGLCETRLQGCNLRDKGSPAGIRLSLGWIGLAHCACVLFGLGKGLAGSFQPALRGVDLVSGLFRLSGSRLRLVSRDGAFLVEVSSSVCRPARLGFDRLRRTKFFFGRGDRPAILGQIGLGLRYLRRLHRNHGQGCQLTPRFLETSLQAVAVGRVPAISHRNRARKTTAKTLQRSRSRNGVVWRWDDRRQDCAGLDRFADLARFEPQDSRYRRPEGHERPVGDRGDTAHPVITIEGRDGKRAGACGEDPENDPSTS